MVIAVEERLPMKNDSEFEKLYPFSGKEFSVDGERMHYLDEGEGKPILMVHGNPTWSFFYRNLVRDLRQNGHRCIAPDHIGCGFSTKPQNYPYTLARHIENLDRLVAHLKLDDITLVVHDWGGAIGMGFAVRHPEKIRRIVILNTAAFLSPHIPWRINICRLPLFGPLAIRGFNGFAKPATKMATTQKGGLKKEIARGFLKPYGNWHDRVANLRFVQDIPMKSSHPSYETLAAIEKELPRFRETPALICWGGKDFCFNDHFLERWRKEWPHAEVHRFENAGHYVLEDAYGEILPLISNFCAGPKVD